MAFGLGALRLPPAAFWAMTLTELAAAAGAGAPRPSDFRRKMLDRLMARFPD